MKTKAISKNEEVISNQLSTISKNEEAFSNQLSAISKNENQAIRLPNSKFRNPKSFFTLIELLLGMSILVIMMSILMRFFGGAQAIITNSANKMEIYENAALAMDMMAKDIQCVYYDTSGSGVAPVSVSQTASSDITIKTISPVSEILLCVKCH